MTRIEPAKMDDPATDQALSVLVDHELDVRHDNGMVSTCLLDVNQLGTRHPGFLSRLLDEPRRALADLWRAAVRTDGYAPRGMIVELRRTSKLLETPTPWNLIRVSALGRLCRLQGRVLRIGRPHPRILVATFMCQHCGCIIRTNQHGDELTVPNACWESEGGCGRRSCMTLQEDECGNADCQVLEIAGPSDGDAVVLAEFVGRLPEATKVGDLLDVVGALTTMAIKENGRAIRRGFGLQVLEVVDAPTRP